MLLRISVSLRSEEVRWPTTTPKQPQIRIKKTTIISERSGLPFVIEKPPCDLPGENNSISLYALGPSWLAKERQSAGFYAKFAALRGNRTGGMQTTYIDLDNSTMVLPV